MKIEKYITECRLRWLELKHPRARFNENKQFGDGALLPNRIVYRRKPGTVWNWQGPRPWWSTDEMVK